MWNYVQVNNLWYAINIGLNAQSDNPEEFLLVGADKMKYRHLVAEIACDDSKNFTVPTLNSQDYGYIEGIERKDGQYVMGVQWHPEAMAQFDSYDRKILEDFISETKKYKILKKNP